MHYLHLHIAGALGGSTPMWVNLAQVLHITFDDQKQTATLTDSTKQYQTRDPADIAALRAFLAQQAP